METNPEKLVKKAQKSLKKTVLKWNRDYPSAALYYDQAAKIYKANGDYEKVS